MTLNLGILAIFIASILGGIAVTAEKKVSISYKNKDTALVWKYIFVAFFSVIYINIVSAVKGIPVFPALDMQSFGVFLLMTFIGYLGTYRIFKAYEHMCSAIVLIIVKLYVFLTFFVNLYLFDGPEFLPRYQIILAIIFFLIIAQFILQDRSDPRDFRNLNKYALYPIGVALCATVFTASTTRFIKHEIMTPEQLVFTAETMLLFIAFFFYFVFHGGSMEDLKNAFRIKHIIPLSILGICIVSAGFFRYYAYLDNPANVVNFIGLLSVIRTAIFGWIFLRDKLTKKQITLIFFALVILAAFVLSPTVSV